jgi:hypothetical protein
VRGSLLATGRAPWAAITTCVALSPTHRHTHTHTHARTQALTCAWGHVQALNYLSGLDAQGLPIAAAVAPLTADERADVETLSVHCWANLAGAGWGTATAAAHERGPQGVRTHRLRRSRVGRGWPAPVCLAKEARWDRVVHWTTKVNRCSGPCHGRRVSCPCAEGRGPVCLCVCVCACLRV